MDINWNSVKASVAKVAPLLGTALGGPSGAAVGTLVASALGVEDKPDAVARALETDPQAAVKLRELELTHKAAMERMLLEAETTRLAEVNHTIRMETQACDPYVRRWRPTFGYVTAGTWLLQSVALMLGIIGAVFVYPEHSGEILNGLSALMAAMVTMWAIALSVLGINISSRSADKRVAAGQDGRGPLGLLAENLTQRKP
jgi:hypothetical protein